MAHQSEEVTIDGQSNEWTFPLRYYDSKTKLTFYVSNDSKKLYLVFATGDNSAAIKASRSGLKIELDTALKNKYPMSIHCKLKAGMDRTEFPQGRFEDFRNDSMRKLMPHRSFPIEIKTAGLRNIPAGVISNPNPYNINVAMVPRDHSGRFFSELAIPFSSFLKDTLNEEDEHRVISIRITLNKVEMDMDRPKPQFSMDAGPQGGSMGGGNMGMGGAPPMGGGGPRPGGGMQPGMDPNSDLSTSTGFVIKLKPAIP